MDFALRHLGLTPKARDVSPLAWLVFQCRNIDTHTMRKHAFARDFFGKTLSQRRLAQLLNSRFGLPKKRNSPLRVLIPSDFKIDLPGDSLN